MLQTNYFTYGENPTQYYYFFKNEVTKELVQIIRNKKESHWFGMYDNGDTFFVIPEYSEQEASVMLQKVCDWYNGGKPRAEYREAPPAQPKKISKSLYEIESMLGTFPLSSAQRIQAYLDEPCVERWDDISGIIIDGWKTVWQLLIEEDVTFPKSGRTTDIKGKVVKEWERIPQPLDVLRAIKKGIQRKKSIREGSF